MGLVFPVPVHAAGDASPAVRLHPHQEQEQEWGGCKAWAAMEAVAGSAGMNTVVWQIATLMQGYYEVASGAAPEEVGGCSLAEGGHYDGVG